MKNSAYEVPTKVLLAQARSTLRELAIDATAPRRAALKELGIDAENFTAELQSATDALQEIEAEQERAKAHYQHEASEDRAIAEEGYRYKLALDARVRAYIATNGDDDGLRNRFRFGQLRVARARGVTYELRIVLPEAQAFKDKLAAVGVDDAFIQKGYDILARLDADRQETTQARAQREKLTRQVREGELRLSRLLAQLVAADEALAVATPAEGRVFRLDLIRAELGRIEAAREERLAASDMPVIDED